MTNQQLLAQWAPLVFIHPEETYCPASVGTLLQSAYLYLNDEPVLSPPLSVTQLPTGAAVNKAYSLFYADQTNIIDLPANSPLRGDPLVTLQPWNVLGSQAVCYGRVLPPTSTKTFIDLLYCFCSGYNGPSGLNGWLPAIGVHVGDWEHVVVRITQPTNNSQSVPLAIYYARHRTNDGAWYAPEDCEWVTTSSLTPGPYDPTQTQQPVVYSAWYSHASYPHAGSHKNPQWGSLAKDYCERGPVWPTWTTVVDSESLPADQDWTKYCGLWGNTIGKLITEDGPESPSFQSWWNSFFAPNYPWVSQGEIGDDALSNRRPGLAALDGTVYCFYTGLTPKLNLITYANGKWSGRQQILSGATASSGVAAATFGTSGQIMIVYNPGGASASLQMAIYTPSTDAWIGPQDTNVLSNTGAALAEIDGTLYMATIDDNNNVRISAYLNQIWEPASFSPIGQSSVEPALAAFHGALYCAFVGAGSNQLYWTSSRGGAGAWSAPAPMGSNKTNSGPALQRFRFDDNFDTLFCLYQGLNDNLDFTVFDGDQWSQYAQVSHFQASCGPALTVSNDQLVSVYVGTSSGNAIYGATLAAIHSRVPRGG